MSFVARVGITRDPFEVAENMGLEVIRVENAPFDIATSGDTLLVRKCGRCGLFVWVGIAQVMLRDYGAEWTAEEAWQAGEVLSRSGWLQPIPRNAT